MSDLSTLELQLARRIALELGIHDSQVVLESVRRHHGGIYARHDELTSDEYDALRDVVEAELMGSEPGLFE